MSAKILIADDEPMARELLAEWLASEEMEVVTAADGDEALKMALAIVPDVILLDVTMPGMDGFEVCRRLREEPSVAEVPVILVTALADRASRLKGIEAGADEFVAKPYDGVELRARVRTITRLDRYRRLLSERTKFEWVVESSDDGYVLLDGGDRIVYANPAARLHLGRVSGDRRPIEEPFLGIASCEYQTEPREAWATWPEPSQTPRYLVRPETPSAGSFWLRVEVLDLPAQGGVRRLVRLRDETSRIVLKRDMWKFNSLVSHKLRTPLTTILGGLEILAAEIGETPKEELAQFVEMAAGGARRLQEEIVRVLDALKISDLARRSGEGFEPEDLPALAAGIGQELDVADLSIDVVGLSAHHRLVISTEAFELILRELLANAKKFHPQGSPAIELRASLESEPERPHGVMKLTVGDDGTHVPPELLAKVWVPYFQNEKGFSGSVEGMGLGLSVVASLVWGVGGRCRIYNQEQGPGIVVELMIPLAHETAEIPSCGDT